MSECQDEVDTTSTALGLARSYVERGWRVFPVHGLRDVSGAKLCTCGKATCEDRAKHPRTQRGHKDASVDADQVTEWWTDSDSNVGIATGNGLFVLDIDARSQGDESLAELEAANEPLPETLTVLTGGGGCHYYFKVNKKYKNSASHIGKGIDVRCDGGYVVAPPSAHASGGVYAFDVGTEEMAELPEWIAKLAKKKQDKPAQEGEGDNLEFVQGARNDHLASMAGTLRRQGCATPTVRTSLMSENKERCKPPLPKAEVEKIVLSAERNFTAAQSVTAHNEEDQWKSDLRLTQDGNPTRDVGNATILMKHREQWKDALCYDEFANKAKWNRNAPPLANGALDPPLEGALVTDADIVYVHHWMAKIERVTFSRDAVAMAIDAASKQRTIHPVRSYLSDLKWDGKKRCKTWIMDYLGARESETNRSYVDSVGLWWLVSAVARIMDPGCQADHILVLEAAQGTGKSTGMETLIGKEWYLGSLPDLTNKDAMVALNGHWVCEIAELDAIRGVRQTKVKDFISQRVDDYRPPYGRFNVVRKRQCVFVGTTNEHEYLADPTGARRFWPVRVGLIDREAIARDRDQIWAEAVHLYHEGAQWWPAATDEWLLKEEQEDRHMHDEWEEFIAAWLYRTKAKDVTVTEILKFCFVIDPEKWDRRMQNRVANALTRLGYRKRRIRKGGEGRKYVYTKEQEDGSDDPNGSPLSRGPDGERSDLA